MFRYQDSAGFRVAVDACRGLPVKKEFCKAIYCLSPPGGLYLPTPLTGNVHFTQQNDLDSPVKHPVWLDGFQVRTAHIILY